MANVRARMLSWTISRDARVSRLSCAYAKLLYTWMIPHCDNVGRMVGEPHEVRSTVLPRERTVSDRDVGFWLAEMDTLGLVCLYKVDGMQYVQMTGWEKHQKIVGNMKRTSMLPHPSADVLRACILRSYDVATEVEVEVEGTRDRERFPSIAGESSG